MLNKLKKKMKKEVKDIAGVDSIIDEFTGKLEKIKSDAEGAIGEELGVLTAKAQEADSIISGIDEKVKGGVDKIFEDGNKVIRDNIEKTQTNLTSSVSSMEDFIEERVEATIQSIEKVVKDRVEEIAVKAEAAAKKKFESEMQSKGLIYFIKSLLGLK